MFPFDLWFESLQIPDRYLVVSRLTRVRHGNLGEINYVGGSVWELKFRKGSGFRIYFARVGIQILLLIAGGDKGSQNRDIPRAQQLFAAYQRGKF